ncbi:unnamed protein product [Clavelina lepadiformis]|uniref:Uncharacterized protein n=1 Tax=Clavelina lepadiformis TaxID=159417 RepID=A0ABP0FNY2_CLALP
MGPGIQIVKQKHKLIQANFIKNLSSTYTFYTNKILLSQVLQVVGDVSKQEDMERIIKETADRFGKIHVLVNSAGVAPAVLISTFTLDQFDRCFNVNVRAALYLT